MSYDNIEGYRKRNFSDPEWLTVPNREYDGVALFTSWRQKFATLLGSISFKQAQLHALAKNLSKSFAYIGADQGDVGLTTDSTVTDRQLIIRHINDFKSMQLDTMKIEQWKLKMSAFLQIATIRELLQQISKRDNRKKLKLCFFVVLLATIDLVGIKRLQAPDCKFALDVVRNGLEGRWEQHCRTYNFSSCFHDVISCHEVICSHFQLYL